MTNYEKIKQMSVEEMTNILWTITNCCCENGREGVGCGCCPINNRFCCSRIDFLEWLESEVETE